MATSSQLENTLATEKQLVEMTHAELLAYTTQLIGDLENICRGQTEKNFFCDTCRSYEDIIKSPYRYRFYECHSCSQQCCESCCKSYLDSDFWYCAKCFENLTD